MVGSSFIFTLPSCMYCTKALNLNLSVTRDNLKPFCKFEALACDTQNYYIWGTQQRASAQNGF